MGKPSAPDTISLHMPEPTGRDAHDSPYWKVGPVLVSVAVIEYGEDAGKHGVFVDSFEAVTDALQLAAAILAANKVRMAADARAARARTRTEQVEEIARNESTADLLKMQDSALRSGDTESANLFSDAVMWQAAHPLTEAAR